MALDAQQLFEALPSIRDARVADAGSFSHSVVIPFATYSPWLDDPAFLATFQAIQGNSLVDLYRAYSLWSLVAQTAPLAGDLLEVGVWRGGTGCLIAARARALGISGRVHLCDTFQGVALAGPMDPVYRGGEHSDASPEVVADLARSMRLDNIEILQGVFPLETGDALANHRFRFCHIDVDVYESARLTLDWVWPRLSPGGIVVFDDYGFIKCDGVTRMVNERLGQEDCVMLHNLTGQAVLVKTR